MLADLDEAEDDKQATEAVLENRPLLAFVLDRIVPVIEVTVRISHHPRAWFKGPWRLGERAWSAMFLVVAIMHRFALLPWVRKRGAFRGRAGAGRRGQVRAGAGRRGPGFSSGSAAGGGAEGWAGLAPGSYVSADKRGYRAGQKNPAAKKKAVVAIAHTLLKIAYSVLRTGTPCQDLGAPGPAT